MIRIGAFEVTASRWPWQDGYNWRGMTNSTAPLNNGARFGGGWKYSLGVETGGWSESGWHLHFDLLFGSVSVKWKTKHGRAKDKEWEEFLLKRKIDKAVDDASTKLRDAHAAERQRIEDEYKVRFDALFESEQRAAADRDTLRRDAAILTEALRALHCRAEDVTRQACDDKPGAGGNWDNWIDSVSDYASNLKHANEDAFKVLAEHGVCPPVPEAPQPAPVKPGARDTEDEIPF